MLSDPGTLGAGAKTRPGSNMKKFVPHVSVIEMFVIELFQAPSQFRQGASEACSTALREPLLIYE